MASLSPVEARSRELAECAALQAANEAGELLRYLEPIIHGSIEEAETAAYYRKVYEIMEQREAGLMNDEHSIAPGVTAFLRGGQDISCIEEKKEKTSLDFQYEAQELDTVSGKVLRLRFPKGGYRIKSKYVRLGEDIAFEAKGIAMLTKTLEVTTDEVIRIEGDAGELWQNPSCLPDGTTREEF